MEQKKQKQNRGGGRPPEKIDLAFKDALKRYDNIALVALEFGLKSKDFRFLKLFLEYRHGRPKDQIDITTQGESLNTPLINFIKK